MLKINKNIDLVVFITHDTEHNLTMMVNSLEFSWKGKKDIVCEWHHEPERGIHPAKRREILRDIVRSANTGTKVVLSTQCDYILRELNTLIMLGSVPDGKVKDRDEVVKELNKEYPNLKYKPKDYINHKRVAAYELTHNEVSIEATEQPIDKCGFTSKSIDTVIRQMTSQSREIWLSLDY